MNTQVPVHLAYGQLALRCCVYSMSALINRHNMVDRTPENVVRCLCGTLLPPDTISTTRCLSCRHPPPLGVFTAVFSSRQISAAVYLFHPLRSEEGRHGHHVWLCFQIISCSATYFNVGDICRFQIKVFAGLCGYKWRSQEEVNILLGLFPLSNLSI